MSDDNVQRFLKDAAAKKLDRDVARQAERRRVDARNVRLQQVGIKQPASGVFGRAAKSKDS